MLEDLQPHIGGANKRGLKAHIHVTFVSF